mmetsp:Transcript_64671/g.75890  ORF Transcript_64671/g.75890 Transcript_64671/m.75890 type:complete len:335 (+) Transcript_64671:181-1185(+)|eukprot:CAMPEP_0194354498 /NCGR_PEP_ID=MMETSP0174-20130528/2652_1 /TAXON_ID=216777 /ORGANISM="Proboscia alata, Strain PI-D3" /LENGTH=334 /DNA_ID=CAMNT_0039123475 /DNA_START=103 /DNA_END=1107 /DNA_ORIENTATION=+
MVVLSSYFFPVIILVLFHHPSFIQFGNALITNKHHIYNSAPPLFITSRIHDNNNNIYHRRRHQTISGGATSLRMGFFQDIFNDAFANDSNLSSDDLGIDDGNILDDIIKENNAGKTEMQKKFLEATAKQERRARAGMSKKGAPVQAEALVGTKWNLDLFLVGANGKDPSSDLYGSRTNISTRDRSLAVGQSSPVEPTVSVEIMLDTDGICRVDEGDFTSGLEGQWKIDLNDGNNIRFSLDVLGYRRTVQTMGTISKVFWSEEDEASSKVSTLYEIPPGLIYADSSVSYGSRPGVFVMDEKNAILKIEKKEGLLGVRSSMVPIGKFAATMIQSED